MDKIQIFKNEQFGEIRTVVNESGEPMFCLADVCKALGLTNPTMVKQSLKQDALSSNEVMDSLGRKQQATFINESNLYKCIFQSRKPDAEKFQDWVTEEVLPSIRKHGAYLTPDKIEEVLNDPDTIIKLATTLKEERQKRIKAESTVAILTHTNKTFTCTEVAKELGFKSATELNNILQKLRVQYKQNDTWVPYSEYSTLAWFQIKQEVLDNGRIIYHRKITGIGREGIINLLKQRGLVA